MVPGKPGRAFLPGQTSRGQITCPGYEHLKWEAVVQQMEPERLFSFTWKPSAIDPEKDHSNEPSTLVEFRLEPKGEGTLLTFTESGFSKLPADHRDEAFRRNDGGWTEQMKSIERHVDANELAPSPTRGCFAGTPRSSPRSATDRRLSLLATLSAGVPRSISQLTADSKMSRQAITKHLRVLESAGLVRAASAGRERRFALEPRPFGAAGLISISSRSSGTKH